MSDSIESMPCQVILARCEDAWSLTDLSFVRKMENIVYSCKRHGVNVYLRLTSPIRRSKGEIEAELDFIQHLSKAGLRVPSPLPHAGTERILSLKTAEQRFEAVLFEEVEGEHPSEELATSDAYLRKLGACMGVMHNVSQRYEPNAQREQWNEERGLRHARQAMGESAATDLAVRLQTALVWMNSLDRGSDLYGLVHADLGAMNLFVDEKGRIGIIDFDDSCMHFFAFDLAVVIYSTAMRFQNALGDPREQEWLVALLEGYREVRTVTDAQVAQIPRFMEFACLRLYFWIEHHETLGTFHSDELARIRQMKQWAADRARASEAHTNR